MWLVTGNKFAVFILQHVFKSHSCVDWTDPLLNLLNWILVVDVCVCARARVCVYGYTYSHVSMKGINCVSLCCKPSCKNLRWYEVFEHPF
jgi:hypothetical protein